MTQDEICQWMHMAWNFTTSVDNLKRKFEYHEGDYLPYERFAKLVADHEREACAKVCEKLILAYAGNSSVTAQQCADAIRSRGDKNG